MKKHIHWQYLIVGFLFLIISNGRYTAPIATWIAPLFLLCFTRKTNNKYVYFIMSIIIGIANQIAFWKFASSNPHSILFYLPFFLGFVLSIPFLVDKILLNSFKGIVKTLIFPITYTVVEFIYVSLSPLGSTGTLAYTQTDFTSLIQIVSITGIYGVTFLITWFASVASDAICTNNISFKNKNITSFGVVFILIITFGGIRLLIPEESKTVRVSGLHVYDLRSKEVLDTWDNVATAPDKFREMCDKILQDLIDGTKKEASAGSKIVIWSEISPLMLYQDQDVYIDTIKSTAKENKIIIIASPYILSKDLKGKDTNELLIINSEGNVILQHIKYGGAMLDNIIEGNKKLQTVSTPYGRLSGVICWDADFPEIMRQEGRLGTDILFSPAADWKEVDPIHSAPAYFRGIENGMSVLRQTVNGLSFASDTKGRLLSKMDHYSSSNWVIVAQIPTHRSFTLYPYIGYAFAITNCFAFILLMSLYIKTRIVKRV